MRRAYCVPLMTIGTQFTQQPSGRLSANEKGFTNSAQRIFDAVGSGALIAYHRERGLCELILKGHHGGASEKRRAEKCATDRSREAGMMKRETITIADVYVPVKRRATLEQKRVDEIAASMLDKGQQTPILVRADGARFVLVEGLHRLEAAKALGEKTIVGFLVEARKH